MCLFYPLSYLISHLAKSWSENPKLQTHKHKLTLSEPEVHSCCFKEILAFQIWRILHCLHWGLSLPASAVSLLCRSDSSWLMSNCITSWSNCTSINNCVATGCTGLAHWRPEWLLQVVLLVQVLPKCGWTFTIQTFPVWKWVLMMCWYI